jgi:hypothetical protein
MAELIARKELNELDYKNLRAYLTDMAIRERKEVLSSLIVLIIHHLKWQMQPERRSESWRLTIEEQSEDLRDTFEESRVLSNHAENVLAKAYRRAVRRAANETGLPQSAFPATSKLSAREWVELPVPALER